LCGGSAIGGVSG